LTPVLVPGIGAVPGAMRVRPGSVIPVGGVEMNVGETMDGLIDVPVGAVVVDIGRTGIDDPAALPEGLANGSRAAEAGLPEFCTGSMARAALNEANASVLNTVAAHQVCNFMTSSF
jgi:hypothetical protein